MEKRRLDLAKDRRIFVIAYCSVALIIFLSIIIYPRLFRNDYPKAVAHTKHLFSEKKHTLHELRLMFKEVEGAFPNYVVRVEMFSNRNLIELQLDSIGENGDLISRGIYYDNWPIDKPNGLMNKMRFAGIDAIRNRGEAIYFRIEEDLLWSNTGYLVYSESHVEGAFIDSNWYTVFVEDK